MFYLISRGKQRLRNSMFTKKTNTMIELNNSLSRWLFSTTRKSNAIINTPSTVKTYIVSAGSLVKRPRIHVIRNRTYLVVISSFTTTVRRSYYTQIWIKCLTNKFSNKSMFTRLQILLRIHLCIFIIVRNCTSIFFSNTEFYWSFLYLSVQNQQIIIVH